MKGLRAGKRYSKALIDLAKDQSSLDAVHKDVLLIQQSLEESNELVSLLDSPIVKTEKKIQILEEIYNGKVNELTLRFLLMVAEQKRESALPTILASFIEIYNEEHGIASVQVTTATEISDEIRKELRRKIMESYNFKDIELTEVVDEKLIGGMVIRIGDKQIDESVRRKLNEIHQELINGK